MFEVQSKKSQSSLNKQVRDVRNQHLSFHIHYWGIDSSHFDNLAHKHSFFEICYVVDGCGTYIDNNVELPLRENTLFMSRPGITHQIRSDTGLELLFVAFEINSEESSNEWNQLFQFLRETENFLMQDAKNSLTLDIWTTLIHAAFLSFSQSDTLCSLALALLTTFPEAFTEYTVQDQRYSAPIKGNPIVERAMLFIRDNLAEPIYLDMVAAYLNISSRHLSRLLKQVTGMGYNAYVQSERIAFARQLLNETNYQIKDIAEMTGFSSVHYFTNVFTRMSNETPSIYRRNHSVISNVE